MTVNTQTIERQTLLRDAETKAAHLFSEVEKQQLVQAGMSERELNKKVYQLAFDMYGIKKYWHKRIVRAGVNTLCPYKENPRDLTIQEDDILFFDFGPVFEDSKADYGRTYVLGNDLQKLKLKNDIEECWKIAKEHYMAAPEMSGSDLYRYVEGLAFERGWEYGQEHCGHLIGNFPHERIQGDDIENYIHPDNTQAMSDNDKNGKSRDWILEIHFVDREHQIGGFFEQLLTIS